MGDVAIFLNPATFSGDFAMAGAGLATGRGLETAVLISLFTDAAADPADPMPDAQRADPRGWWADSYEGEPTGSKLWQAYWRPANQDTLNWARDQALKALGWMLGDGVAAAVAARAAWGPRGRLELVVEVTEPGGGRSRFAYAWAQEGVTALPAA